MQAAQTVCTYAPPYHQRCWLLNWMLITRWKVSLFFSPEDTASVISNKNVTFGLVWHNTLFHFETVHFNLALAHRMALLDYVHIWLPFCMIELKLASADGTADCVYRQWFLEVFLGPFGNFNDRTMPISDAVSSEAFSLCPSLLLRDSASRRQWFSHLIQLISSLVETEKTELGVSDKGDIQNVQGRGACRTGLKTTALRHPFYS